MTPTLATVTAIACGLTMSGGCATHSNRTKAEIDNTHQKVTTFFMFEGRAEEAMNFYSSLFDDASIVEIERYGPDGPGQEGSVYRATFSIQGQRFMFFDSPINHPFTFTPSISLFVSCDTTAEIDDLFTQLSEGGQVMMPLQAYPFSPKFAWVSDRFGVSWQLYIEPDE